MELLAKFLAEDSDNFSSSLWSATLVGSSVLAGKVAASVACQQSNPKSRKDGFSPVGECDMLQ